MTKRPLIVVGSRSREASLAVLNRWREMDLAPVILEIDERVDKTRAPREARFCTYETHLSEEQLEEIDREAAAFAKTWYCAGFGDTTLYREVSAGRAIWILVFLETVNLLKNVACAAATLTDEIEQVVCGEGVSIIPWAWKAVAKQRGIPFVRLPARPLARDPAPDRASRTRPAGTITGEGDTVIAVRTGRKTCEGWFERLRFSGRFTLRPAVPRIPPLRLVSGVLRFVRRWVRHAGTFGRSAAFRYRDIDLWPYWRPRLRRLFVRELPYAWAAAETMREDWMSAGVKAVIASWHELDGALAEAAAAARIPLIVLQDSWLPGERFPAGYRRVVRCDHLMVWGEISANWARHIDGAQIHILGGPAAIQPPVRVRTGGAKLRVVLGHQCWGPWSAFHSPLDTNDMWAATAAAARAVPHVDFVGKIHPLVDDPMHEGAGRTREIEAWVAAQALPNFRLADRDNSLDEVLRDAHLLVTYYSLTALEALVQQIPVAVMNLTNKRDLFPELTEIGGCEVAYSVTDLVAIVRRLASGNEGPDPAATRRLLEAVFAPPRDVLSLVESVIERNDR